MEAFVYIWNNLTDNKKYIGYHKGTIDDGYICSSKNEKFWDDFNDITKEWSREIIFKGTMNEAYSYEQKILKGIDLRSNKWYNNARGAEVIFTEDVKSKMSESQKERWKNVNDDLRETHSNRMSIKSKLFWNNLSDDDKKKLSQKISESVKAYWYNLSEVEKLDRIQKISDANRGQHYHSEEWKKHLSDKLIGNTLGSLQSEESRQKKRELFLSDKNPGKNKSEETKRKISESKKGKPSRMKGIKRKQIECPHCGKIGGDGLMQRWHFDNCNKKNNER